MRKIRLSDGSVWEVAFFVALGGELRVTVATDLDLRGAVDVFGRPENVQTIEYYIEGSTSGHAVYEGYSELRQASYAPDGIYMTFKEVKDVTENG